jgi:predicted Zn-dependent protease
MLTVCCCRNELEADHIGIMLLASAGFDPHILPRFLDKAGKIKGESLLINLLVSVLLSSHPSCKKRVRLLSQPNVMEAAMELYRTVNKH